MQEYVKPALEKKDYSEVMVEAYKIMGVCAINYYNLFQNYMTLFYKHIESNITKTNEFKCFDIITITTIFDTFLMNVQSNDENK